MWGSQKLAHMNQRYEAKFGHIFIVCASSRSAEDMLAAVQQRQACHHSSYTCKCCREHPLMLHYFMEMQLTACKGASRQAAC